MRHDQERHQEPVLRFSKDLPLQRSTLRLSNYHAWHRRSTLTIILVGAFTWSLLNIDWREPLLHTGGVDAAARLLASMLQPDLSPDLLYLGLVAAWRTLAYATAGVTLAYVLAVPLGILASGVLVRNSLLRPLTATAFRICLGFLRAIHELVWAWLFVAAIGLSPIAAVLAIAIPYAGILGRILAEMLNDVPEAPLRSLRTAGASEGQALLYGRLSIAFADMVSYALYRYECGIRSAAIMSFIGLGGLGYQIQISLDDLQYRQVWTFVYMLAALVVLVDGWSNLIRRRLVS